MRKGGRGRKEKGGRKRKKGRGRKEGEKAGRGEFGGGDEGMNEGVKEVRWVGKKEEGGKEG